MTETILADLDAEPEAATAKRARRKVSDAQRRRLFVILGALLAVLSVAGFYVTSDAFDSRVPVLVAAVSIDEGETITSAHLASADAQFDAIPYLAFSPENVALFEGQIAAHSIEEGTLMRAGMTIEPLSTPVGDQLELMVPLDLSLEPSGVHPGDEVLLIDPGQSPSAEDPGRPRRVLEALMLRDFDGTNMRLLLPPEEWATWRASLDRLGTSPMVLAVPLGGVAEEFAQRLDAVWHAEHSESAQAIVDAQLASGDALSAGPGELEIYVGLDTSLVPSGLSDGDRVLIIDPGVEPTLESPGRPRQVIRKTVVTNYRDGQMRLFLQPDDWIYWQQLSRDLGARPMVLVVSPGTDEAALVDALDAAWADAYEHALNAVYSPEGSGFIAADEPEELPAAQ